MKKKTNRHSRNKKRRHVYPYTCQCCGKRRLAFIYQRAKDKMCTNCELKNFVDENQPTLL